MEGPNLSVSGTDSSGVLATTHNKEYTIFPIVWGT